MIDIRQREKTDFEQSVIKKSYQLDDDEIQLKMFDTCNYGYFVSSFYGEFILQDNTEIKTINHFIKCEDYIYCFIEEIIENKYDDLMWYAYDYTQKIQSKSVFRLQDSHYMLVDFISNIKEIDDELSILKLIRIFGDNSNYLNKFEKSSCCFSSVSHSLLFHKFQLNNPYFDEYDKNGQQIVLATFEERQKNIEYYKNTIKNFFE